MISVALLFDINNDWLQPYLPETLVDRKDLSLEVFYDHNEVSSFQLVFVLGYTKILPESFIKRNQLVLVVHESDLPKGKGFSPVQWQIIERKDCITVSLIELQKEVDSGNIFEQAQLVFNGSELYNEIREKQAEITFFLIQKFIDKYPHVVSKKQVGTSTFYKKRIGADGELNIDASIREQFNVLRVGNNEEWPSFFCLGGVTYYIKIYRQTEK